jgi:hypothetical protein
MIKTANSILISIPVLRRHQDFYLEIKNNISLVGLVPLFFTTCEVNANYWSKILGIKVQAPSYQPSIINKISSKDWSNILKKGNEAYSIDVSLDVVFNVQKAQQPQRFSKRSAFDTAFNNSYLYLLDLVSRNNVIHAFNAAAALDYDNFVFNLAVANSNIKIIFLSYSPIANYELSFTKKYYSQHLEKEPNELIVNSVEKLINGYQIKDPNSGYLVARGKDRFLSAKRFISHCKIAYLTPGASIGRMLYNTCKRWTVNYYPNKLIIFFFKENILNLSRVADILFIGTTINESFFIASKYYNSYISEICSFAKRNPDLVCVYKPHPATLHQYLMYSEFRKLHENGVIISMESNNFENWKKLKIVLGLSSSTLIHASLRGIPTYCLEPGFHEYFGVKRLKSFSDIGKIISLRAINQDFNIPDKAQISRIVFKGIQRFYDKDSATEAAKSVVEAITISTSIKKQANHLDKIEP